MNPLLEINPPGSMLRLPAGGFSEGKEFRSPAKTRSVYESLKWAILSAAVLSWAVLGSFRATASSSLPKSDRAPFDLAQPLQSPDAVPEGLSRSDWSAIRSEYEKNRHAVRPVEGEPGVWQARNPSQRWLTRFDGTSFLAQPDGGGWKWGLALQRYGFAGNERTISATSQVITDTQRVTYRWDDLVEEWFINDARGLEHGFTVKERPAGEGGRLRFELAVNGGLNPKVTEDRRGVRFLDSNGGSVVNYTGLKVWDADGKVLAADFDLEGERIILAVDERDARYPLTIDPVAQQAYLKASNTGSFDEFGFSVALSGDTVVVGARYEASNATGVGGDESNNSVSRAGAAYVFVRNGTSWSQQAYLKASNTGANDSFGQAVAISGDTIVVGAHDESSNATGVNGNGSNNSASESGAAYVFVRNGTTWTQQAYLKASNTEEDDTFGYSVSISGDTVVVGAMGEDSNATGINGDGSNNSVSDSGAAYVFVRDGSTWSQQAFLKASNAQEDDLFGKTVSISGDTIVVGAPDEDSNAIGVNGNESDNSVSAAGAAYVFVRNGTTWSQQAYLKASNPGSTDRFGEALAISGDIIAVGASGEDSNASGVNGDGSNNLRSDSGAAYVFVRSGTSWSQEAFLKPSNPQNTDLFGTSVAVSGEAVAVGSIGDDSTVSNSGAVYVFSRNGTEWSRQAFLKASIPGGDNFGFSVAMSGETVVAGARLEGSNATGVNGDASNDSSHASGAAYVFLVTTGPSVSSVDRQSPSSEHTSAASVTYRVTFSESVTGVDVNDFTLTKTGSADGTIASVSTSSGTAIDVTVNSVSGNGTLRLDLNGSGTGIKNGAAEDIGGGFTTGQTYTIDNTAPTVSIGASSASITKSGPITFTVTYSDANFATSSLASGHISLNTTGNATGTVTVDSGTGTSRTVTLSNISGDGTIGISIASGTATDLAGNSASASSASATFAVDNTAPSVTISNPSVSGTVSGPVTYTITYADANFDSSILVSGNITLNKTGTADGSVSLSGSGTSYTVTISTITGNGTLGISIASATASDTVGNSSTAAGPSATFAVGAQVSSINRANATPSNAGTVNWTVMFTTSVTDVSASNFTLSPTVAGASITSVTGSGTTWNVAVNTGTGDGTLQLNLANGTGISPTLITPSFNGQSYVIDKTAPSAPSAPDLAAGNDSGISNTDNITNDTTPDLSGTAEANSTVELFRGGSTSMGTTTANGGGAWTFTTSTLPDGIYSITAKATDATGNVSAASGVLSLTIDTTAPTISDTSDRTINEDSNTGAVVFTIGDAVVAPDSLTFVKNSSDTTLVPLDNIVLGGSGANRTITVTPAANLHGSATITLTLSDPAGHSTSDTFVLTVTSVNDAPTVSEISNVNIAEDAPTVTVHLSGITPGPGNESGQSLTFTATSDNSAVVPSATINYTSPNTTGTLSFTPTANIHGTATVTVIVGDTGGTSNGGVNSFARSFTVRVMPQNDEPSLAAIANQTVVEGSELTFTAQGSDIDGDVLTYSLDPGAPAGAAINPLTGVFEWTPSKEQGPGTYAITVRAKDPSLWSAARTFQVTVSDVQQANTAPIMATMLPITAVQGGLLLITNLALDVDLPPQQLTWSLAAGAPQGMTINPANGLIQWTPLEPGTFQITQIVTDNGTPSLSGSQTYAVHVVGKPNAAPTITPLSELQVENGGTEVKVKLTGITSGASNEVQTLSVAAVSSNPGLLPNPVITYQSPSSSGELVLKAVAGQVGEAMVTVTVKDDGGTANGGQDTMVVQFKVTVKAETFATIYFQHSVGVWGIWQMRAENQVKAAQLNPAFPTAYGTKVVAVADFDEDGERDLLTEELDGKMVVYFLNGTQIKSQSPLNPSRTGDANWTLVAAGDFNRDGKSDIVFQHMDGTLAIWIVDGLNLVESWIVTPALSEQGWRVAGAGDFNRDGTSDLVFQHLDGSVAVWLMADNGTATEALWVAQSILEPNLSSYYVRGVTDLDKDGKVDLLWQGLDDSLYVWFLDGTQAREAKAFNPRSIDLGWRIVGP